MWKDFWRRRRDLRELKGVPWWKVRRATEEREGAALEEGTEEFYDSRKEQRRHPEERPSRRLRRRDAIRPATLPEMRGSHSCMERARKRHNGKAGGRVGKGTTSTELGGREVKGTRDKGEWEDRSRKREEGNLIKTSKPERSREEAIEERKDKERTVWQKIRLEKQRDSEQHR
ncbi:hypothetical protein NDU88_006259 [Pleurodeles waltl]|uniref:Uncharacterized protein n=1 Tax=Pleurodeles waltl TaxID=8319 RepID=A0AAV7UKJ0_PLEWA|nr:hypothetical protein NDU88_006259 [Pleurodeles waltl]